MRHPTGFVQMAAFYRNSGRERHLRCERHIWSFYKPVCTKPVTCRQYQKPSFSYVHEAENMVFNLVQKLFHYNNWFQSYARLNLIDIELREIPVQRCE